MECIVRLIPLLFLLACGGPKTSTPQPVPAEANQPRGVLYDLPLTALDGTSFDASSLKGKTVLVVNVASRCGFTPQYEGLQALWEAKESEGLVIVGVPCNQFMGQEPGDAKEIASFCKINYGVTFPLLDKQDVNGAGRSDLYRWLVGSPVGADEKVKWNFEKFVIDRNGVVTARFGSKTAPEDPDLLAAIDAALKG